MKWGRPSILLAVHKSKPSQLKAEVALKNKLKKIGTNVIEIEVGIESPDALHSILASGADPEKSVFLISNIDQGGGEDGRAAYRALNLYRETFIENHVKAVFWLTANEESKLPKYAPDFWAFRHRVVEFSSPHQPKEAIPPVGLLMWGMQRLTSSPGIINEMVIARKKLLSELPDSQESVSSRIELFHTLGYLYWSLGDVTQANIQLISAVDLARRDEFVDLRIQLLNGLAILAYENENYQEALNIYTELVEKRPLNSLLRINLAVVLSALGKNYLAIVEGGKAVKIDPLNAEIIFTLGYLFLMSGKLDEAVDLVKKSIQLSPETTEFQEILAVCYSRKGLVEDARDQMEMAINWRGETVQQAKICKELLFGKFEDALIDLKNAIQTGEISRYALFRSPVFNLVLDQATLQDILR